jgi:sulfopyruvate decarboxylase TPP-binding subunit
MKSDPAIRYVECAAENQALTTAMGMYVGGMTPMVMMQNQGLLNCLNTLRSVGIDAGIPLVLCVGAFGRENSNLGHPLTDSARVLVNRVEPVVAAMGLPFFNCETPADLGNATAAFKAACDNNCAAILHLGFYPSWT